MYYLREPFYGQSELETKEVGIKKLLGANRILLFRQFMLESYQLVTCALLLAILITYVSIPLFNQFTGEKFSLSFGTPEIWEVLGGVFIATILLTGIYPAVLLSSLESSIHGKGSGIF